MALYLIHFDAPLSGRAQHYLGWTDDVESRVAEHHATTWERYDEPQTLDGRRHNGCSHGSGATLIGAVNTAGIAWQVVRTWPKGSRQEERRLKKFHKLRVLCPICNPAHWATRGKRLKV